MEQSILKSTKQVLHIAPDDPSFDLDVMTHINSAFSTLSDLGLGPVGGFVIEDDTANWSDFVADTEKIQQSRIKTFVFLHTRLLFDPPSAGYLLDAANKQLEEALVRLSINRENKDWVDPNPPAPTYVDPFLVDPASWG